MPLPGLARARARLLTAIVGVSVACDHDQYLDREDSASKSGICLLPILAYSLAQGTNASVSLAHSRGAGREVVVKIMKKVGARHFSPVPSQFACAGGEACGQSHSRTYPRWPMACTG